MPEPSEEDHASVAWSTNANDTNPSIIGSEHLRTVSAADVVDPAGGGGNGGGNGNGGNGNGGGAGPGGDGVAAADGGGSGKKECGLGSTFGLLAVLAALLMPLSAGRRRAR